MLKSCKYCGKIHDTKIICPYKPQYSPKKYSEPNRIRHTNRWAKTSAQIRDRDHHLCLYCLSQNKLRTNDLEVHHIVSLEEDETQAYLWSNLITLCRYHHELAEDGRITKKELFELVQRSTDGSLIPPSFDS